MVGNIGIFTVDIALTIKLWDKWMSDATGITSKDAINKSVVSLFPYIEEKGIAHLLKDVIEKGTAVVLSPVFHNYIIKCKPQKKTKYFEYMQQKATLAPLVENDKITGAIITIEDVTEQLEREKEFKEKLHSLNEEERLNAIDEFLKEPTESIEPLIDALKDHSWKVRKAAVTGLVKKGGKEAISALLLAIKDEHKNISLLNSALQVLTISGLDIINPLIEFLKSPDADLRIYAAQLLGEYGDINAVTALINALEDKNLNVRYHAIESLGKLKAIQAVEYLIQIVESKDFYLSYPAIEALMKIEDKSIAGRLVPLLEDENLSIPTAEALGILGDENAIEPLTSMLNTHEDYVSVVIHAIARIYYNYEKYYKEGSLIADLFRNRIESTGIQNIINKIEKVESNELKDFVLVLGWLEGPLIEKTLTKLLGNPDARREVIEALVRYGSKITDLLIEQIDSEDIDTSKSAIIALGRIGDKKAVPHLIRQLDNDSDFIIIAAGALAKIGDRIAFEPLLRLLGHEDPKVRQAIISALNSIGHPEMSSRIKELLTSKDDLIRESAVKIAGYFGYPECIELILELSNDSCENVRQAAIQSLPYIEDNRVYSIIRNSLKSDTPKVRAAAAYALGKINDKQVLTDLVSAIEDNDMWVRYYAIRSLGNYRDKETLRIIEKLILEEKNNLVKIAAIEAAGNIGGEKAISLIENFINNKDNNISLSAINALCKMSDSKALNKVLSYLKNLKPDLKKEAIRFLGRHKREEVISALQWIAASETDEDISGTAIETLGKIESPYAIKALIELTSDRRLREKSIISLSQYKEKYIDDIAKGLLHHQSDVRRSIIKALARMKNPRATEALSSSLEDQDFRVRLEVINVINNIGSRNNDKKLAFIANSDPEEIVRNAAKKALFK